MLSGMSFSIGKIIVQPQFLEFLVNFGDRKWLKTNDVMCPRFMFSSCTWGVPSMIYPLVMTNIVIENSHRNSWFTHEKWWIFRIVYVNVYQGVTGVWHLVLNCNPWVHSPHQVATIEIGRCSASNRWPLPVKGSGQQFLQCCCAFYINSGSSSIWKPCIPNAPCTE